MHGTTCGNFILLDILIQNIDRDMHQTGSKQGKHLWPYIKMRAYKPHSNT